MTVAEIIERHRRTIADTDRLDPVDRDQVYAALVADLRSRRPECVSPLTLGPPTDRAAIRDPRGMSGR